MVLYESARALHGRPSKSLRLTHKKVFYFYRKDFFLDSNMRLFHHHISIKYMLSLLCTFLWYRNYFLLIILFFKLFWMFQLRWWGVIMTICSSILCQNQDGTTSGSKLPFQIHWYSFSLLFSFHRSLFSLSCLLLALLCILPTLSSILFTFHFSLYYFLFTPFRFLIYQLFLFTPLIAHPPPFPLSSQTILIFVLLLPYHTSFCLLWWHHSRHIIT